MSDILWLSCKDNPITYNKKNYLLMTADRLGYSFVKDYTTHQDEEIAFSLNIEPYSFLKSSGWTGLWEIDLIIDREEFNHEVWEQVDTIFTATTGLPIRLEKFREKSVPLFLAVDSVLHKKPMDIIPQYDFVHAGSRTLEIYSERDRLIQLLQEKGFSFFDHNKDKNLTAYMRCLADGRIQFVRSVGCNYLQGEIPQSFFEKAVVGPTLLNWTPDCNFLNMYDGLDVMYYKDDEELLEKMKWLKDNPELASKLYEKGNKKILTYHTYEHRLKFIINYLVKYYKFQI